MMSDEPQIRCIHRQRKPGGRRKRFPVPVTCQPEERQIKLTPCERSGGAENRHIRLETPPEHGVSQLAEMVGAFPERSERLVGTLGELDGFCFRSIESEDGGIGGFVSR